MSTANNAPAVEVPGFFGREIEESDPPLPYDPMLEWQRVKTKSGFKEHSRPSPKGVVHHQNKPKRANPVSIPPNLDEGVQLFDLCFVHGFRSNQLSMEWIERHVNAILGDEDSILKAPKEGIVYKLIEIVPGDARNTIVLIKIKPVLSAIRITKVYGADTSFGAKRVTNSLVATLITTEESIPLEGKELRSLAIVRGASPNWLEATARRRALQSWLSQVSGFHLLAIGGLVAQRIGEAGWEINAILIIVGVGIKPHQVSKIITDLGLSSGPPQTLLAGGFGYELYLTFSDFVKYRYGSWTTIAGGNSIAITGLVNPWDLTSLFGTLNALKEVKGFYREVVDNELAIMVNLSWAVDQLEELRSSVQPFLSPDGQVIRREAYGVEELRRLRAIFTKADTSPSPWLRGGEDPDEFKGITKGRSQLMQGAKAAASMSGDGPRSSTSAMDISSSHTTTSGSRGSTEGQSRPINAWIPSSSPIVATEWSPWTNRSGEYSSRARITTPSSLTEASVNQELMKINEKHDRLEALVLHLTQLIQGRGKGNEQFQQVQATEHSPKRKFIAASPEFAATSPCASFPAGDEPMNINPEEETSVQTSNPNPLPHTSQSFGWVTTDLYLTQPTEEAYVTGAENPLGLQVVPDKGRAMDSQGNYIIPIGLGVIARAVIARGERLWCKGDLVAEDELQRLADNGRAGYIYRVGNRIVDGRSAREQGDFASAINSHVHLRNVDTEEIAIPAVSLHYSPGQGAFYYLFTRNVDAGEFIYARYGGSYKLTITCQDRLYNIPIRALTMATEEGQAYAARRLSSLSASSHQLTLSIKISGHLNGLDAELVNELLHHAHQRNPKAISAILHGKAYYQVTRTCKPVAKDAVKVNETGFCFFDSLYYAHCMFFHLPFPPTFEQRRLLISSWLQGVMISDETEAFTEEEKHRFTAKQAAAITALSDGSTSLPPSLWNTTGFLCRAESNVPKALWSEDGQTLFHSTFHSGDVITGAGIREMFSVHATHIVHGSAHFFPLAKLTLRLADLDACLESLTRDILNIVHV